MKGVIPAKLWKTTLEIRALTTFVQNKGSYCIRDITKNSSCRIYIQKKYKHIRKGISTQIVQFNSSNSEKMLLIVKPTYEKWIKDRGMEAEDKGLVGLLGVKDSDTLKLSNREGKVEPNDYHTDLGSISTQLPSPSQPVLPAEHGERSPRSQTGVPRLPR